MAISLDGRIARHADEADAVRAETGFGHPDDQVHLRQLIANANAVIVGARTLKAAGGILGVTGNSLMPQPHWYIASRSASALEIATQKPPGVTCTVVTPESVQMLLRHDDLSFVRCQADASWPLTVVSDIKARNLQSVLVLGGASVNRDFYQADLVDELIITVLPIILGHKGAIPLVQPQLACPVSVELTSSQHAGNLVFLTYRVHKNSS